MIENNTREFWLALQITDASFPSGALANSQGLESAMYAGLVDKTNLDTLSKYAEMLLRQVFLLLLIHYIVN